MNNDSPGPAVAYYLFLISAGLFLSACLGMYPFNPGMVVLLVSSIVFAWVGVGIIRQKSN
jgi:hypothetical protein